MLVEIAIGLICALLAWNYLKKPANYPPGYWGLPLIGYIPLNGKSVNEHVFELRKKYNSNVVIWRMGSQIMVFVFNYKLIKETLSKTEFINRPDFKVFKFFGEDWENYGLTFRNGLGWHNGRRFSLRLLRDLGMGKSKLVSAIQCEARDLVDELTKTAAIPRALPRSLSVASVNVIWQMMASKKFTSSDEELLKLEELIADIQSNFRTLLILDFLPWLSNVIPSFLWRKIFNNNFYNEFKNKVSNFMVKQIKDHEASLNTDDPRDYIDYYLLEMKGQESDANSTMSIPDLVNCCIDLFTAGSETTKATLLWTLFYLANHQKIQMRLQKEVDDILPKGTLASLEDKSMMPYTEAVIHEALRLSSFQPLGLMREATHDVEIEGYLIPKGGILNSVFTDCHFDPNIWDSPEEFRPERFLDAEGKFVSPKEGFIPFGSGKSGMLTLVCTIGNVVPYPKFSGKRKCVGESLAKMEIFIFLTAIVQNLTFSPPPGKFMDLKPVEGNPASNLPKEDQDIVITLR